MAHPSNVERTYARVRTKGRQVEQDQQQGVLTEYAKAEPIYRSFASSLRTLSEQLCGAVNVVTHVVEARAKEVDSLVGKFDRHPELKLLDDVTDLCGVRIVVYYATDVTRVTE